MKELETNTEALVVGAKNKHTLIQQRERDDKVGEHVLPRYKSEWDKEKRTRKICQKTFASGKLQIGKTIDAETSCGPEGNQKLASF